MVIANQHAEREESSSMLLNIKVTYTPLLSELGMLGWKGVEKH